MTIRRKNTTRKGPVATKRSRNQLHSYETIELTMPGMNGQSVDPIKVADLIADYETDDGWVDTYISGVPTSYTVVNIPAELLVPWQMNQRRAEEFVNALVENGERIKMPVPRTKKAVIAGMKEESISLLENHDMEALILGMLDNLGPLDPCDVIVRKDGFFDVCEGNRRTAASHFLTGFLGDDSRLDKALSKSTRDEVQRTLLSRAYPGVVPCRVFRDISKKELRELLERHHLGGKTDWPAFVQAKSAFESFEEGVGQRFTLRTTADLKVLKKELNDKKNIEVVKSIARRCQMSKYARIRYRIMAFAANAVFKVQYKQPSGLRAKFDTFRRFYDLGCLRTVCDGGELTLKQNGKPFHTGYVSKNFEGQFIKWVAEGRIHDTIQVSELPWVLAYDDIREELFVGGDPSKPDFFKKCSDAVDRKRNGSTTRFLDNLDDMYETIAKTSTATVSELGDLKIESKKIREMSKKLQQICKRLD